VSSLAALSEGHELNMQLIFRNDADDIAFEHMTPNTPKRFDDSLQRDVFSHNRNARGSADDEMYRFVKDNATPDSPISQVSPKAKRKLPPHFQLFMKI
jgi:hypothetical protein